MTNVTYLPWVDPNQSPSAEDSSVGSAPSGVESTGLFSEKLGLALDSVPASASSSPGESSDKASRRPRFVDVEDDEASGLDLEALEASLLRKLGRADMSVHEVRVWLRSKDAAEGDANELIDKCERLGYLNDERLAVTLTERLSDRKGKSRGAIAGELRQRGIPSSFIDAALNDIEDDAEQARADELAHARVRQFRQLDDATAERRLTGYLSRRGYSGSIVRQAVRGAMSTRN